MLFKKSYGELVQEALSQLQSNTDITNVSIGAITRSIIEVINRNIADYYNALDINVAMGFLSTAEGYFLDLIGDLFNMPRKIQERAAAGAVDKIQKFYVTEGTLGDKIPTGVIPRNTIVSTTDGLISYYITEDVNFSLSATFVYVPITAEASGSAYNVGKNKLIRSDLGVEGVYTTNDATIVSGADTELDDNYRYRLANAALSAEKANEVSVRLAALSVEGVADVIIRKYARGIGSYDVLVIPMEGIATVGLISNVQEALDKVQALGIRGTAIAPTVVPVDLEIKLIFTNGTTETERRIIREDTKTAIEKYIVNIPVGGTFIVNELRQQIMNVSPKIKDHIIHCYYFREQPYFKRNVEIYWDEMFYPNPDSVEAIIVS